MPQPSWKRPGRATRRQWRRDRKRSWSRPLPAAHVPPMRYRARRIVRLYWPVPFVLSALATLAAYLVSR